MENGPCPPADEDADLLRAWEVYAAKVRENDSLEAVLGLDDMDPLWKAQGDIMTAMLDMPAHTMAGVAVKLRPLFVEMFSGAREGEAVHAAAYYGKPLPPELLDYSYRRAFWNLIQEVDRMADAHAASLAAARRRCEREEEPRPYPELLTAIEYDAAQRQRLAAGRPLTAPDSCNGCKNEHDCGLVPICRARAGLGIAPCGGHHE